mgnify:CR=1 FL=1
MPVGTAGTVKAVYADQLKAAGVDIVLANTYHLMLRPGAERIARPRRAAHLHGRGTQTDLDGLRGFPGR